MGGRTYLAEGSQLLKHYGFSPTLSTLLDCRAQRAIQISISHYYKEQFQELSVLFIGTPGKKGRLLPRVILSTTEERRYHLANTS